MMTSSQAIYLHVSYIQQLFRPSIENVRRHYCKHENISEELNNLLNKVVRSENCKIGIEFIMCLDEFQGGYFQDETALAVDNLRNGGDGAVKWVGRLW